MIRPSSHWGIGEWIVVLIWKVATLAMAVVTGYIGLTGDNWGLRGVGIFYVPFSLCLFIFTQPDV